MATRAACDAGPRGKGDLTARQGSETARTPVGLHRFVVFTTVCTFFLLIAGCLVTSNDAGLSVPSWPFAPGTLLPRMVGALTLASAVWLSLVAFRLFGPVGEFAMVPALRPGPRRREQTVSVRTS